LRPKFQRKSVRHVSDRLSEILEIRRETSLQAREHCFCQKSRSSERKWHKNDVTTFKGSLCGMSRIGSRKFSRFDVGQVSKRASVVLAEQMDFPSPNRRKLCHSLGTTSGRRRSDRPSETLESRSGTSLETRQCDFCQQNEFPDHELHKHDVTPSKESLGDTSRIEFRTFSRFDGGQSARKLFLSKNGLSAREFHKNDVTASEGSLGDMSGNESRKLARFGAIQVSKRVNVTFVKKVDSPNGDCSNASHLPVEVWATRLGLSLGNSRDSTGDRSRSA
jgi:hypothetical protein